MKTLFLSAVVALVSLQVTASGTKEKSVATLVCIQSFEREFGYQEDVKWSNAANNMLKAEFVKDEDNVTAYFTANGDLVASTQELTYKELPKDLRTAISKKLPKARVTNAFSINDNRNTSYYFVTEQNGERKLYKGNVFGNFTRHYVDMF